MKSINLLTNQWSKPRVVFAASLAWALILVACERKAATVEVGLPANPTVQSGDPVAVMTPTAPAISRPVARTTSFETSGLGTAIDTFEKAPTVDNQSSVKLAFAKLDEKIAELQDRAAKTDGQDRAEANAKADNLQSYRNAEMTRYTRDQDGLALDAMPPPANPPVDSRSVAQKAKDTAEEVGDKVKQGAEKVGRGLDKAARKTGDAIDDVTH